MGARAIQGAFGIFILGTLISCIAYGTWFSTNDLGVISTLASFSVNKFQISGGLSIPTGITAYWDAMVTVISWNYPYLASPWCIFIKMFLWIVSAGVVIGLIQMAIYVISALVGFVRSIIGY